ASSVAVSPATCSCSDVIHDGAVRVVRTEHDLRRADQTLECAELQEVRRLRRVVIEAPQMVQPRVRRRGLGQSLAREIALAKESIHQPVAASLAAMAFARSKACGDSDAIALIAAIRFSH